MFWKNANKRINRLLEALQIFECNYKKLEVQVEIIEQKLKSKFFKKKEDLEENLEHDKIEKSLSTDGLDELRKLAKDG